MIKKNFTFVLPAAGKSSRFNSKKSKIFFNFKNKIIISHVIDKCLIFSKNIIIVSNKKNLKELRKNLKNYKDIKFKIYIQKKQIGMGDAVNIALKKVKTKYTVVIWPDQIFLSINTIKKTINFFLKKKLLLCFPTFKKKFPYVYILRDKDKNFKDIIQTRETRKKVKFGESDCGMFVFNTKKISKHLEYLIKKKK